jgi:hypothetical protein
VELHNFFINPGYPENRPGRSGGSAPGTRYRSVVRSSILVLTFFCETDAGVAGTPDGSGVGRCVRKRTLPWRGALGCDPGAFFLRHRM